MMSTLAPCSHTYAVFHLGDPRFPTLHDVAFDPNSDDLVLLLPLEARPTALEGQDVQATLEDGVLSWRGADGAVHQIGDAATPFHEQAQELLLSEEGILVFYVDEASGTAVDTAIFRA